MTQQNAGDNRHIDNCGARCNLTGEIMTFSMPTFGLDTVAIAVAIAFVLGMSVGSAAVVTLQQWKRKRAHG
uniref:hypothetical protein n=1 Tax=Pseudomonas fluorescens TaxID=294 RepID=UPI001866CCD3|nr:hypothetical protein [Pseudomonas fluorescens]